MYSVTVGGNTWILSKETTLLVQGLQNVSGRNATILYAFPEGAQWINVDDTVTDLQAKLGA